MKNKTNQQPKICACPHCGSTDFRITETVLWKGSTSEDTPNVIDCFHKGNDAPTIECKKCSKDISDFINDNFELNFQ